MEVIRTSFMNEKNKIDLKKMKLLYIIIRIQRLYNVLTNK